MAIIMPDDGEHLATIEAFAAADEAAGAVLTLPYDSRKRSRQRVALDDGRRAALLLPRGTVLRNGDRLKLGAAEVVLVKAAPESVSTVTAADPVQLARVAYHLGNRHVPLQVGPGWLRYQHDHVLDAMVQGLGAGVTAELAPFEPEGGAHSGAAEDSDHSHSHHHHGHGHG